MTTLSILTPGGRRWHLGERVVGCGCALFVAAGVAFGAAGVVGAYMAVRDLIAYLTRF